MYYIGLKFLSREPKKTMNFVRDIAIPVILLLSVGGIIVGVNSQLTYLLTLGGQNDILVIRDIQQPIEKSIIPVSLVGILNNSNIEKIVPLVYQNIPVIINESNTIIHTTLQVVFVNITDLNDILPFKTITSKHLNNLTVFDAIIGSQIVQSLNLSSELLTSYSILTTNSNVTLYPTIIMNEPDIFVNVLTLNNSSIKFVNQTYNGSYYSELLVKVKDKSKIVSTANQIQGKIDNFFPQYDCQVVQGTGTYSLLSNVLSTIIQQLSIFNFILDVIILIRIIQSLMWIANDFEYEINELKILGASVLQVFLIFIIISLIIGNLGFILGFFGTLILPTIISYLISLVTIQTVSLSIPSLDLIFSFFIQTNILVILIAIIPSYFFATKRIIRQKERE